MGVSIFEYYEAKDWGYRTSRIAYIFTLETTAISESLTHIDEIQGHNFGIFSDSRSVTTAISQKPMEKDPHSFPALTNSPRRQGLPGNALIYIGSHRGITGNKKANELAKHSIRHGRDNQIQRRISAVAPGGGMGQGTEILYVIPC
jgi:hypothetical protein